MQKTVLSIILYAIGIWALMKMGIGLFWAVILLLVIKGLFRFVGCLLRLIPISLVIAILVIYFLSRI